MTPAQRAVMVTVLREYRIRRSWGHRPIDAAALLNSHYARCCAENTAAGRYRGARDDARYYLASWTVLQEITRRAGGLDYWVYGATAAVHNRHRLGVLL